MYLRYSSGSGGRGNMSFNRNQPSLRGRGGNRTLNNTRGGNTLPPVPRAGGNLTYVSPTAQPTPPSSSSFPSTPVPLTTIARPRGNPTYVSPTASSASSSYPSFSSLPPPDFVAPRLRGNLTYVSPTAQPNISSSSSSSSSFAPAPLLTAPRPRGNLTYVSPTAQFNTPMPTPPSFFSPPPFFTPAPSLSRFRRRQKKAAGLRSLTYRRLESLQYVRDEKNQQETTEEEKKTIQESREKMKQKRLLLQISSLAGMINRFKTKKATIKASFRHRHRNLVHNVQNAINNKTLAPNKTSSFRNRNLVLKNSMKKTQKKKQYCMFYNRFGKCNKEGKGCRFVHDPAMVAVCRKFLKGKCDDPKCLLNHTVDKNKMPVCKHFLRGLCSKEDCPYLHVNVNPDAPICPDFLKGHCPLGPKCKLRHQYQKKKMDEKKQKKRKKDDEEDEREEKYEEREEEQEEQEKKRRKK